MTQNSHWIIVPHSFHFLCAQFQTISLQKFWKIHWIKGNCRGRPEVPCLQQYKWILRIILTKFSLGFSHHFHYLSPFYPKQIVWEDSEFEYKSAFQKNKSLNKSQVTIEFLSLYRPALLRCVKELMLTVKCPKEVPCASCK